LLATIGGVMVAIDVPFFVAALATLQRGFPKGELFTRGVYAMCRHPRAGVRGQLPRLSACFAFRF